MNIMVTGGAGYIGSHGVQRLLRDGHRVVAVDNLSRGHAAAIELLRKESGGKLSFVEGDVGDRGLMEKVLRGHGVTAVMHFAGLTYVGESVEQPLAYYRNNVAGGLSLLEACDAAGVEKFVFSSTCATYGEPSDVFIPIPETCPQSPINPYGWSKLHMERMLADYAARARGEGKKFAYAALRYFNVAGCDRSGVLGEHHEPETHLIPVVLQAALGQRESVTIFGADYPTPDGTCIRDYVHVEDLIDAHVVVMGALGAVPPTGAAPVGAARGARSPVAGGTDRSEQRSVARGPNLVYNLGIGKGYSVREIIESCKCVTGKRVAVKEGARRAGDPPRLLADARKVEGELGWRARVTALDEIVGSAWRWMERNPGGYGRSGTAAQRQGHN